MGMAKFVESDERVTLAQQTENDIGGPVILINRFSVNPKDADQFIEAWTDDAAAFKRQPGFISTQLHRGIAGSGIFVNYAVWESTAAFKKATSNIDVQTIFSKYPPSTVASPHLFKKVRVPGICEA
jgi:quinol monooxygenase YgiN